ncbi:hypothetical protein FRC08_005802 [Ceratobasidium sp. 394]|nr:hypothetical protein FRC08_005802 [Ceratobasidium sp. 394]
MFQPVVALVDTSRWAKYISAPIPIFISQRKIKYNPLGAGTLRAQIAQQYAKMQRHAFIPDTNSYADVGGVSVHHIPSKRARFSQSLFATLEAHTPSIAPSCVKRGMFVRIA